MKFSKLWHVAGIFLTVISVINLFGEIGTLELSDWLANVTEAYRKVVYPVVDFITWPLTHWLHIQFDPWKKDMVVILSFFMNRYVSDFVSIQLADMMSPANGRSNYSRKVRSHRLFNNTRLGRFYVRTCAFERRMALFAKKHRRVIHAVFTKLLTVCVLVAFIFGIRELSDVDLFGENEYEYTELVFFFFCLFVIPAVFAFLLLANLLMSCCRYLIKILCFLVRKLLVRSSSSRRIAFPAFRHSAHRGHCKLLKKQMLFNLQFIALFMVFIGVNYKYPELFGVFDSA